MAEKRPYKNPQFNLRIPEDLKEKIALRAKSNGRSLNAEIGVILQGAIDQEAVRVQSEFSVDLFKEQPSDDDKLTISKKQLLKMVDITVQQAIDATAEALSKKVAEATFDSMAERFDFVLKGNKKPT